ncbi:L,D-transpeptidase family protein [Rhizobium sp. HT1-10]|uniref:L,D-transpeptidase family protein n=1 Tax=Rhizobium sp. HT1-10 TaxID=3111638 RepID=UPI003C26BA16
MFSRLVLGIGLLSATALTHPAGATDARVLQIVVSTNRQQLSVYDGDTVVATSKVSTGKSGHSTPMGIFSVLEKEIYHRSNIYSNSPMPFMQRLTWSGIALHESNSVPNYPASHGCVRMPKAFAKKLYEMTQPGVHVVIADAAVVPQPIAHATLFHPLAPSTHGPMFSDLELRPTTPGFLVRSEPVEVAMNDTAALPPPPPLAAPRNEAPLSILITRRGLRENVRDLQQLLSGLGFDTGTADGYLGPATVQAIRDFRSAHAMPATGGLIGPDLMKAVYAAAGKGEPPNGAILVRQGFKPVLEASATIAEPQEALGTHFFTAHEVDRTSGQAQWYGLTLEGDLSKEAKKRYGITSERVSEGFDAAERALDRITVPDDIRRQVEDLLTAGSSLTISDTGVGPETGKGTDFITITRKGGLATKKG